MFFDQNSRRHFLKRMGLWSLAGVATATGLVACGGKEEAEELAAKPSRAISAAEEAANPCQNLSEMSEAEIETRDTFDYEDRSEDGTELCRTCSYWRPSQRGDFCGGCTLVKGPIHPLGTCSSWEEVAG